MATPVRVNEDNYVRLESEARKERRSVTSQLNVILDGRYGRNTVGVPPKNTPQSRKDDINDLFNAPTPEKNKIEATPSSGLPDAKDILQSNMEQVCCKNELQPCKHWVWDAQTGEGYKNTLSGRLMEVE